jgi:sugar lactone lactonase YvrE
MTPVCVAPVGGRCGEAATWDAATGTLYWCDVNRFLIHARNHASGLMRSWLFDRPVTALALTDRPGTLLVALSTHLIYWRPEDDVREDHGMALADWPEARLNDGRAGPDGDFWLGSMGNNVGPNGEAGEVVGTPGRLFRVAPGGGAAEPLLDAIGIANTVCWSPDTRTFYFGDTTRNVIWAFDRDPATGAVSNRRDFFTGFARGLPDGSAVDAEGYLWNCRFGGGCVVRVAPDGHVDRILEMPVANPTTCAFGGPDLKTLYVTSASILTTESDRLAGSLFAVEAPVAGLDGYRYATSA